MKGSYLIESIKGYEGIKNKVLAQVKAFEQAGLSVEYIELDSRTKIDKIMHRLPFCPVNNRFKKKMISKDTEYLYIRKPTIDLYFLLFLKKIKKNREDIKIILEIPTYPYDQETKITILNFPIIVKEKIWRKRLYKYVDRVVTYSLHDKIFDIPTIITVNGIDFDKNPLKRTSNFTNQIHIIGVAKFAKWHGYDRVIKGMYKYYQNGGEREVYLHLVGDGEEERYYKELVEKFEIQDKVKFYGVLQGQELNKVYDKCNIGLASIGLHRIGLESASTLKAREYVARGLPVIGGGVIDVFNKRSRYTYSMDLNEEDVDVKCIIEFYDEIYGGGASPDDIGQEIRELAKEKCDMSTTLKEVIEFIKDGK